MIFFFIFLSIQSVANSGVLVSEAVQQFLSHGYNNPDISRVGVSLQQNGRNIGRRWIDILLSHIDIYEYVLPNVSQLRLRSQLFQAGFMERFECSSADKMHLTVDAESDVDAHRLSSVKPYEVKSIASVLASALDETASYVAGGMSIDEVLGILF